MKRVNRLIAVLMGVLLFCSLTARGATLSYLPDELLVVVEGKTRAAGIALLQDFSPGATLDSFILSPGSPQRQRRVYRLRLEPEQQLHSLARRLSNLPGVVHVQPNYRYRLLETPSLPDDPEFYRQWGLHNTGQMNGLPGADISAATAWQVTTGSRSVVVAVIDTGIDYTHPDLQANLWINPGESEFSNGVDNDGNGYIDDRLGWNFHDGSNDPMDEHSHGTHVAGIIGAVGDNGVGIAGVCWKVRLMALTAFDKKGESETAHLIEAIAYAEMMGAQIINASWGNATEDPLMLESIRSFTATGGLFIAAAGNGNGKNNDVFTSYPANYDVDGLLSIGASNVQDRMSNFSSVGKNRVHLFAPGSLIYSTFPTLQRNYGNKSGTSMAAPMVTGAAALLWSWNPELNNLSVKYRLMGAVDRIPELESLCLSGGRLNAAALFDPDLVPPDAVTDLTVTDADFDRLTVEYTVTGDDGLLGQARFVEIRYSDAPITPANWEMAHRAEDIPEPAHSGSIQRLEISGLDEDTEFFLRMRVIDRAGNLSPLSNEASGRTRNVTVLFADDVESGTEGWTLAGDPPHWAVTSRISRSGDYCWADSPDGQYSAGQHQLISPPVDLSHAESPVLRFWHRFDVEPVFDVDFIEVQASSDGSHWTALSRWKDTADWWRQVTISLDSFRGQPEVRFRFHLSVVSVERHDGWYVDDIRVLDIARPTAFGGWDIY